MFLINKNVSNKIIGDSKFPITKIQMIMTKDTRDEVENLNFMVKL